MKYSKVSQEGAKQLLNSLGSNSYLYFLGDIIRVRTSLLRRIYSASLLWAYQSVFGLIQAAETTLAESQLIQEPEN